MVKYPKLDKINHFHLIVGLASAFIIILLVVFGPDEINFLGQLSQRQQGQESSAAVPIPCITTAQPTVVDGSQSVNVFINYTVKGRKYYLRVWVPERRGYAYTSSTVTATGMLVKFTIPAVVFTNPRQYTVYTYDATTGRSCGSVNIFSY